MKKIEIIQNIVGAVILSIWLFLINYYFEISTHIYFLIVALVITGFITIINSRIFKADIKNIKLFNKDILDKGFSAHLYFIFINFIIFVIIILFCKLKNNISIELFNCIVFFQVVSILLYITLRLREQQRKFYNVYIKLNDKLREVTDLHSVGMALNSVFELERLLSLILDMIVQILNVEIVTLFLVDSSKKNLTVKIAKGMPKETQSKVKIMIGKGIIGKVAESGESLLIKDINNSEFSKDEKYNKNNNDQKNKYKNDSFICVPLKVKKEVIGVISINNKKDGKAFSEEDLEMASLLSSQAAVAIENANLYNSMHETYLETVKALSAAIDAKDAYTAGHSMHVTEYTIPIAKELKLEREDIEKLEYAGLLHDIGKIGIIESILNKKGRLTDEEFEIIKQHPVIGANIIESIEFLKDVVDLVRYHHERYDGRGYPKGLKGDEIPYGARIIAVADTFDAMTSDRPYRKGLPYQIAAEEIKKCSGTQFDPEIADAFLRIYENGTLKLPERE